MFHAFRRFQAVAANMQDMIEEKRRKEEIKALENMADIIALISRQPAESSNAHLRETFKDFNSLSLLEKARIAETILNTIYQNRQNWKTSRQGIKDWAWIVGVVGASITYIIKSIASFFSS